jgi:hypothetical protein
MAKWSHKTRAELAMMTGAERLAHGRAVLADAAAHGQEIDWLAIAVGLIGDTPADGGVDCGSAARQLGVSASTVRKWLRTGAGAAAAERISAASGVPVHLISKKSN